MRIVSFLPAATEILFALGLAKDIVGVTFECDYPQAATRLPRVVQTCLPSGLAPGEIDRLVSTASAEGRNLYFADLPLLEQLAPDLILTQDLCHVCALDEPTLARDLGSLSSRPRVLSLGAHSLDGTFAQIMEVGAATGAQEQARVVTASLRSRLNAVAALTPLQPKPHVLALEWLAPFFQGGHWVPEMIQLAGGTPVLAEAGERSVRVSWAEIQAEDPEIIVAMPCGYNLEQTVEQLVTTSLPSGWQALRACKEGRLYAVDGSAYFSRPGPRLVEGVELLAAILRDEPGSYVRFAQAGR